MTAPAAIRLARGSAWLLAGQIVVFAAQILYVAITSRLLTPAEFGAYAASAAIVSLVSLIISGGIGQAVMRAQSIDQVDLRSLASIATLLGIVGACFVILTASWWASLWQVEEAAPLLALSAPIVSLAPYTSFLLGVCRREGRFRMIAGASVGASVAGVLVGSFLAMASRAPESLVAGAAAVQVVMLASIQVRLPRTVVPGRISRSITKHLVFSGRVTIASLLSYVNGNLGRLIIARWFGAAELGYWNRAESITLSPFQMLQGALIQSIYPELRSMGGKTPLEQRKVSDILLIVCWLTLPLGIVLACAMPYALPTILGPGWVGAVPTAMVLAIVAGITPVCSLLGSVLEVRERFPFIYLVQFSQVGLVALAGAVAVSTGSLVVLALGILMSQIARHLVQIWYASAAGALSVQGLIKGYCWLGLWLVGAAGWLISALYVLFGLHSLVWVGLGSSLTVAALPLFLIYWRRLPPVVLVFRYVVPHEID